MKIIDITLPLSDQTLVWDGDEGVTIKRVASISNVSDFNVSKVEFGVHAGTHIDAPFHINCQGASVEKIPLEKLIGAVQVLQIDDSEKIITKNVLLTAGFKKGTKRLLLKTRNTDYWVKDPNHFNHDFTALDDGAAEFLAEEGLSLVGIDYFSISPFKNLIAPHQILLQAEIVILENAYLVDVDPGMYTLFCLPLKLTGSDGAPVRAVLIAE